MTIELDRPEIDLDNVNLEPAPVLDKDATAGQSEVDAQLQESANRLFDPAKALEATDYPENDKSLILSAVRAKDANFLRSSLETLQEIAGSKNLPEPRADIEGRIHALEGILLYLGER